MGQNLLWWVGKAADGFCPWQTPISRGQTAQLLLLGRKLRPNCKECTADDRTGWPSARLAWGRQPLPSGGPFSSLLTQYGGYKTPRSIAKARSCLEQHGAAEADRRTSARPTCHSTTTLHECICLALPCAAFCQSACPFRLQPVTLRSPEKQIRAAAPRLYGSQRQGKLANDVS